MSNKRGAGTGGRAYSGRIRNPSEVMKQIPPHLILSLEGFDGAADLMDLAEAHAEKLRRHRDPPIKDVRLNVKRETTPTGAVEFVVCAIAESSGPDYVVHAVAGQPETALVAAFGKLAAAISGRKPGGKSGRRSLAATRSSSVARG